MSKNYPLDALLSTLSKVTKKRDGSFSVIKRTIFNKAFIGGFSSRALVLFFLSLPFIEFALIFNPKVFNYLGIAQSIIFYIVFMSIIMMIIVFVTWRNNKSTFTAIEPSWKSYFSDIDLKILLSSGVSPYSGFFTRYAEVLSDDTSAENLQPALRKIFDTLKEENRDLLEAMEKDRSR